MAIALAAAAAGPRTASLEPFSVTALYEALISAPQTGYVCKHAPAVASRLQRLNSEIETRTKIAATRIRGLGTQQQFDDVDRRNAAGDYFAIVSPAGLYPCGERHDADELKRWGNLMIVLQEFERRAGEE